MRRTMECHGQIRLGSLPWEVSERLAQWRGNWLEFLPEVNSIVFRQAEPPGCPALTGIPCELITLIDSLPPELRESVPGGELSLKDSGDRLLRLEVIKGEVHIRWPHAACYQAAPVSLGEGAETIGSGKARVNGWIRFAGSSAKAGDIRALVDRFGGLYPEEDMPSECEQNMAYIRFRNRILDLQELVAVITGLADPKESLQAELEADRLDADQNVRIQIVDGSIEATSPALRK